MGRFLKAGQFTTANDRTVGGQNLPAGTTGQRSTNPFKGEIRFNTDVGVIEYYEGPINGWLSVSRHGTVEIIKDSFTGDGSTSVYTMSVTPFDENSIFVFVGNVHQNPGVAYTVSGADITFSSPPPDTHTIVILHGFDSNVPI